MKKLVLSKQALVLIAWILSLATILVAGFAGAITELCDAYAGNTADLITHGRVTVLITHGRVTALDSALHLNLYSNRVGSSSGFFRKCVP